MAVNSFRDPPKGNVHGKLYEPKVAAKLGARLQPNSGAMVGAKGDMKIKGFGDQGWLIEVKTTINSTISLDLGWLVKISEEANAARCRPMVTVSFVLPDGRPRPNAETEWVCIPMSVFQELIDVS